MENNYPGGIVPLGADLDYLNGGRYRYDRGREWANDSTNQHTNNFNRETVRAEHSCDRHLFGQAFDTIGNQFENQTRTAEFNRVCDRVQQLDNRVSDNQVAAERRLDDKIGALTEKVDTEFRRLTERELADAKADNIALAAKLDNREQIINNFCCPKPAVCVDQCCNGGGSGGGGNDTQVILQAQAQQFQAMQQTMQSGFQMIAEAIKTIDTNPGQGGGS